MSEKHTERLNELKQKIASGESLEQNEIKEIFIIMLHNEESSSDHTK